MNNIKPLSIGLATIISAAFALQSGRAGPHLAIKASLSGKYVRAGVGQDSRLAAWSPKVYPNGWERFEWISYGQNKFLLRSLLNGKFVQVGSDGLLRANYVQSAARFAPGRALIFEYVSLGGVEFAIRSTLNNRYVRAGIGPYSNLGAVATKVHSRGWERFRWEKVRTSTSGIGSTKQGVKSPSTRFDLAVVDWRYSIDPGGQKITFYPVVKNLGPADYKSTKNGEYRVLARYGSISVQSRKHILSFYPGFSLRAGQTAVLTYGVTVPFYDNDQPLYMYLGACALYHPDDLNTSNNSFDGGSPRGRVSGRWIKSQIQKRR